MGHLLQQPQHRPGVDRQNSHSPDARDDAQGHVEAPRSEALFSAAPRSEETRAVALGPSSELASLLDALGSFAIWTNMYMKIHDAH